MLTYTLTEAQYNELYGLAHHHAMYYYRLERFPDLSEAERERDRKNIEYHFPILDSLGVPFWVQNVVLVWTENWRNYAGNIFRIFLKQKNIFILNKQGETR